MNIAVLNQSSISDRQYDAYLQQIRAYEENPSEIAKQSPSFRVGGTASEKFEKYTRQHVCIHWTIPITKKIYVRFTIVYVKIPPRKRLVSIIEPKIDGLSVVNRF
ncbi:MAG: hypothetical protein R3A45_02375 [Bdellovibrionota bacterium]